jgi:hypothetical protein
MDPIPTGSVCRTVNIILYMTFGYHNRTQVNKEALATLDGSIINLLPALNCKKAFPPCSPHSPVFQPLKHVNALTACKQSLSKEPSTMGDGPFYKYGEMNLFKIWATDLLCVSNVTIKLGYGPGRSLLDAQRQRS